MNLYYYNLIHAQHNVDILIKIYLVVLSDMSRSIFIPLHNPLLKFLRLTDQYLIQSPCSVMEYRSQKTSFDHISKHLEESWSEAKYFGQTSENFEVYGNVIKHRFCDNCRNSRALIG